MNTIDLKEKYAVVTGGSRGIGKTIAHTLVQRGATVLLVSRNEKELKKACGELSKSSGRVEILSGDISTVETAKKVNAHIDKRWGGHLDILINAAGIYGPIGALETLTDDELQQWEQAIRINLLGTVYMCHAAIPHMKATGGTIVNFSGGGDGAHPNFSSYVSSKGAIVRFTETLAAEVKKDNIWVNAIAPGAVNTEFLKKVLEVGPERAGEKFYEQSLEQQKTGGTPPQRTADFILFLLSEGAGLTGNFFSVTWDDTKILAAHKKEINDSDIYKLRRVKPEHRGKEW